MKVGIIGGTGGIGKGMALRLSQNHEVIIGSRKEEKASSSCDDCCDFLKELGLPFNLMPSTNQGVVDNADIVVFAIPPETLQVTIDSLTGLEGKIVVSLMNPMEKGDYFKYVPPEEGSAALELQRMLPQSKVIAAFNNIPAKKWNQISEVLDYSVCVCGDHDEEKQIIMELVNSISELEALNAGPLAVSATVEAITPLVINIAKFNKMRDVGVYFR
ncbi:NADPH-dependent F420 reductase [Methanogenium organophilum]|uniref:NADPH-dependent F420 reductase n=1 Tax=Methanogenium organophilum TaxID=2199 RepID=A0A9X9S3I7_METOG|nr:NADPH-dependent F420 reductase [Methanogenium organophilum]WAI00817.1 NADPH-dependent F420 reductase [Methanogenium organophilum]